MNAILKTMDALTLDLCKGHENHMVIFQNVI